MNGSREAAEGIRRRESIFGFGVSMHGLQNKDPVVLEGCSLFDETPASLPTSLAQPYNKASLLQVTRAGWCSLQPVGVSPHTCGQHFTVYVVLSQGFSHHNPRRVRGLSPFYWWGNRCSEKIRVLWQVWEQKLRARFADPTSRLFSPHQVASPSLPTDILTVLR